jgi:phosphatidylcholine synthase
MFSDGGLAVRILAALVHVFTGLGAICALFATLAIVAGDVRGTFVWLAIALVIDAVDGTMARRVDITTQLPRFSGERLDLVIDYVTYVFVPVLALLLTRQLDGVLGRILASAILLSSLFHFSDLDSKAKDNSFVGFPAIWNIFAFYIFALAPPPWLTATAAALGVVLTFVPMPWVHPMRVVSLRGVTLSITAAAGIAGIVTLAHGFPAGRLAQAILITAALYYLGLALMRWRRAA